MAFSEKVLVNKELLKIGEISGTKRKIL